jgi:integrase/recombinase XerC
MLNGRRVRESLDTRDWQRALRKLVAKEDPDAVQPKGLADAITAFENHIHPLEPSTQRKYRNVLAQFRAFCEGRSIEDLSEVTIEHLDAYRAGRDLARTTAQKELETLRQFFGFCFERKWIEENPAKRIKAPRGAKPQPIVPYEPAEVVKILAACDVIGRHEYERLRARAMVLLLRYTALRISDVATLARDRVRDGRVLLYTQKTGEPVFLPVPGDLRAALDSLPSPRGAGLRLRRRDDGSGEIGSGEFTGTCRGDRPQYYFWNGKTSRRAVVGIAERTLSAVFKASGVPGAHAHRFRHTLATELLGRGASFEQVADILGNSPDIVRKHYGKWSRSRQERIDELMQTVFSGTFLAHEKNQPVVH